MCQNAAALPAPRSRPAAGSNLAPFDCSELPAASSGAGCQRRMVEVTEQPGRLQAPQALKAGRGGSPCHQISDQIIPLWPVDALVVWLWKTIFAFTQTLKCQYAKMETESKTGSLAGGRDSLRKSS